ncbi:threonylcarbamoyl-AMP synthase [Christensenellaceae bacterium OttesenSCG-928-K19]|nr:threonylcarbamoyl-AMP synthase [Christensenellaceae bacterium OttesenSCG-928-K19]
MADAPPLNTQIIFASRDRKRAVEEAAKTILAGDIAVLPTETVYGLAANALDGQAVQKVFAAKGRPQDNPLIVHIAEISMLDDVARDIPQESQALMEAFWPGPLSIVFKKNLNIPDVVSAGLDTVAVRMPHNQLMLDIIKKSGVPVAAPSANRSGRPSPTTAQHAAEDLLGRVPLIIDGGSCSVGVESTVLDMTGDTPLILRPGSITPGMIEKTIGKVDLHPAVLQGLRQGEQAQSPGMKYRHYAPNAAIFVFEGNKKTIAKNINARYDYYNEKSQNPVVFCAQECAPFYAGKETCVLGASHDEIMCSLFARLRQADDIGYGVILFHYTEEMGLAVKNRILRAAEGAAK